MLISLQILRAIAATLVAWSHASNVLVEINPTNGALPLLRYRAMGAVGVDIFFVISGTIITITAAKIKSLADANEFAWHRFVRVVPYYWLLSTPLAFWMASRPEQASLITFDALLATYTFYLGVVFQEVVHLV